MFCCSTTTWWWSPRSSAGCHIGITDALPTLVGSHMLERLRPTTLWTTGEVLDPIDFSITAANETDGYRIDLEEERQESVVPAAFNGWWSCLIPLEAIDKVGLSLPFFIRRDDIEFGYRTGEAGYPTITLPGAAVWHESWDTKDDVDNWTLYFTVRNRLIHAAMESSKLPMSVRRKRARAVLLSVWRNDIVVFFEPTDVRQCRGGGTRGQRLCVRRRHPR